jgi:hypothetical protein
MPCLSFSPKYILKRSRIFLTHQRALFMEKSQPSFEGKVKKTPLTLLTLSFSWPIKSQQTPGQSAQS